MTKKLSLILVSAFAINAFAQSDISLKYGLTSLENEDSMEFKNSTFMIDGTYDLGYAIKPRLELNYISVDDEDRWGGVSSLMQIVLNGQYEVNDIGYGISPYLFGGLGYESVSDGTKVFDSLPFFQAGLGLKYAVNEKFNLLGEVKGLQVIDGNNDSDDEDNEFLFSLGVNFPLQTTSVDAPTPAVAAEVVLAAPVVQQVTILDSDKDGVADDKDACPGTVLKSGMSVNKHGCEIIILLDSDNDGITDDIDTCKDTPIGAKVDASGCAKKETKTVDYAAQGNSINLNINFDLSKATIKAGSKSKIEDFAAYIKSLDASSVVIIEGYTDSSGNASKNKKLSRDRAFAVRQALIKAGVKKSRVRAYGKGSSNPIASNDTAEGRAKNRRIEAILERK
jgi:OOP family OmpA-OmpF porin